MRRKFPKSGFVNSAFPVLPVVLALSASTVASQGSAQTPTSSATDPATRAKEIAAMSPATEKSDLRKAEIKELSVVMSGVEIVLRENIEKVVDIMQFRDKDIPSVSRMRFMHRMAPEQIASALRPYGYYRSTVTSRLSDLGTKWQAVYRVTPGDRVRVNTASVKVTGPGADDPAFKQLQTFAEENITRGQVLDQQLYDNLKRSIQSAAAQLGYFDAEFLAQEILVDLDAYSADVTLHFSTGERYKLGELTLTQDVDWLSDDLIEKFIELEEFQDYDASDIQRLQSDFSNTSYYRSVEVRASPADSVNKVIPVSVNLEHRNPKQYVYGAGYGTDTGTRVRFGVTRRRVNKEGHYYDAQAILSEIGFELGASYTIPTRDPRTDTYGLSLNIEEEDSDSRNFRNISLGGNYRFRDDLWFKTYAIDYEVEENVEEDIISTLLVPSVEWEFTSPFELEDRINVVSGQSLTLELRGASSEIISDTSFVQAQATYKRITSFDFGHRFLARASVGATRVSDFSKLPLSKRFYTGGDRTVRGYSFETLSPSDNEGNLIGGRYLAELGIEYEVPFRPNFSWAVFSDIGDAFNDDIDLRNSFGAGLRWQSPVGPIRIDASRGFDDPSNGAWHLHLGIGPEL